MKVYVVTTDLKYSEKRSLENEPWSDRGCPSGFDSTVEMH